MRIDTGVWVLLTALADCTVDVRMLCKSSCTHLTPGAEINIHHSSSLLLVTNHSEH
jgi:hypothetical protein